MRMLCREIRRLSRLLGCRRRGVGERGPIRGACRQTISVHRLIARPSSSSRRSLLKQPLLMRRRHWHSVPRRTSSSSRCWRSLLVLQTLLLTLLPLLVHQHPLPWWDLSHMRSATARSALPYPGHSRRSSPGWEPGRGCGSGGRRHTRSRRWCRRLPAARCSSSAGSPAAAAAAGAAGRGTSTDSLLLLLLAAIGVGSRRSRGPGARTAGTRSHTGFWRGRER